MEETGLVVIDGDGHLAEPIEVWTRYVDPAYRDRIRVTFDERGWMERILVGDLVIRDAKSPRLWGLGDALSPGGLKEGRIKFLHHEEGHPGGHDGAARLAIHDAEN